VSKTHFDVIPAVGLPTGLLDTHTRQRLVVSEGETVSRTTAGLTGQWETADRH